MLMLKKLTFAPFFIISFALLNFTFNPILKSYDFIFSLSMDTLIQLIVLAALFSLTSLLFVLFATMSMDWKIVAPVGLLAAALPMIFLNPAQGLVLAVGSLAAFILIYVALENKLKSYLTFETSALLGPSIRSLTSFLILIFSFIYFLSVNQMIQKGGFQIPDALIDATIQFAQPASDQSGSSIPQDLTNNLIKSAVKDQIQNFIKPYMDFIPAILAVLLFFTLQSLSSIINLLIYPILKIIFFILEKSGFVKFTTEMRPTKKMVVSY